VFFSISSRHPPLHLFIHFPFGSPQIKPVKAKCFYSSFDSLSLASVMLFLTYSSFRIRTFPNFVPSTHFSTGLILASRSAPLFSMNAHLLICDPLYSLLLGNPAKAERTLGWKRKVDFDSLVKEMVETDLKAAASLVEDQN